MVRTQFTWWSSVLSCFKLNTIVTFCRNWFCSFDLLRGFASCGQLIHRSSLCQDDAPAMDFVTAAANLRMHIFSMNMKSRFDVKCELSPTLTSVSIYFFNVNPDLKSVAHWLICLFQPWQEILSLLLRRPTLWSPASSSWRDWRSSLGRLNPAAQ